MRSLPTRPSIDEKRSVGRFDQHARPAELSYLQAGLLRDFRSRAHESSYPFLLRELSRPPPCASHRIGGVRFTIHDGIVYDAPALLTEGETADMLATSHHADA